ncbi:unnamed protein product, partial [Owenia fusiformis]
LVRKSMASLTRLTLRFLTNTRQILHPIPAVSVTAERGRKRWAVPYYNELYSRRLKVGPEKERHRSEWSNWNYDAEIYAFGKRLKEEFNEHTLKIAFTHRSYIESEESRRSQLGIDDSDVPLNLQDNEELAREGEKLASEHVYAFIRFSHPFLPEEAISAVHDYLMSEEMLATIGLNLGIKDLILCEDFPPEASTMVKTFKAIIGALSRDQGRTQAQQFVQDFICTMLVGKDVNELWDVHNPMGVLVDILQNQGKQPPEARLLRETGSRTVLSCYIVGIYSDTALLGQAPGETLEIAEEMAARDALRNIFCTTEYKSPLKFNTEPEVVTGGSQLILDNAMKYVKSSARQLE